MNQKRDHVAQIEARYGLSVRVEAIQCWLAPISQSKIQNSNTLCPEAAEPVVSADTIVMDEIDEDIAEEDDIETPESEQDEERKPKRRRRRRRRRKGQGGDQAEDQGTKHLMRPLPTRMQPQTRILAKVLKRMRQ